jgi:hypothetical protein
VLDKICNLANNLREKNHYKAASVLYSIATDLALQEEKEYLTQTYEQAHSAMKALSTKLRASGLKRLASEVDIIARDLELKTVAYSVEDPIETVLHSYKVIHKLASSPRIASANYDEIIDLVESESVPDHELPEKIKSLMLGFTEQEKRNILYILEKDYNLSISLNKVAKKKKPHKKTAEQECLEDAKDTKDRAQCLDQEESKLKMEHSWPSAPSMWSGFAYEAVIPYHQNSQLNFWSLASSEEAILKRIAKK